MPPLCTAGFGLATLNWSYFFGAFYLFVINTVFIGAATLLTVRLLKLPHKHLPGPKDEKRVKRIIFLVLATTLVPSIYFGYDIVQQDRFNKNANRFIEKECNLQNDYLLNKKIDSKKRIIQLTFGGSEIPDEKINQLRMRLEYYGLKNASLEIKQGFSYLTDNSNKNRTQFNELTKTLFAKKRKTL